MMHKIFLSIALATLVGVGGLTSAHTEGTSEAAAIAEAVLAEETVTAGDLEVTEPTLLPSSPFYFFKTLGRGIQRAFTFNPVRRVELELRFADEKIAEAKKLAETSPEREQAISRAVANYRTSTERLKAEFERLAETSQNPNVERLLEKLADRAVKHEKVVAELKEKFSGQKDLRGAIDAAGETIGEAVAAAAKRDTPDKFAAKLEKALVETKGGDLKHVRSLEIIDRIHAKADSALREKLAGIREDFAERFKEDLEAFAARHEAGVPDTIREALEKLPGDKARRLIILEELGQRAGKETKEALKDAAEAIEEEVAEHEELAERAREAMGHARERVEKLATAMKAAPSVPEAVTRLAHEANARLERATQAFADTKYGEAFGQARATEVNARNALRLLEHEQPEAEDLKEDIAEFEEKLGAWEARLAHLGPELQPKANEALKMTRFHLRLASETLSQNQTRESKRHLQEAKEALRLLERIFHESRKSEAKSVPQPGLEATRCPALTFPACEESRTSDACWLQVREAAAKYPRCGFEKHLERGGTTERPAEKPREPIAPPPPAPEPKAESRIEPAPAPAAAEFKLEADDRGFYPEQSIAVAKGTKIAITFVVRTENVYYGGLDFRSSKFKTPSVKPGGSTTVEFVADESLVITSYWPLSGVEKAKLKVEVR